MVMVGTRAWARAAIGLAAVAGLGLVILYMAGTIGGGDKIAPGVVPLPVAAEPPAGRHARVERREVEDYLDWPGTVRSRTVASIAPKLLARVLEVKVTAGSAVRAGDPVAVLDDRDLRARVEQARSGLAAAEALAAQAEADAARALSLFERKAATDADLEQAEVRRKTTAAQVDQARQAVKEAETVLGETVVRAPFDGVVIERLVEPGDMAVPGRPIATLHDPRRLRLEALVPEQCAAKARIGMEIAVAIDALGEEVRAAIEEIAPTADPLTRTFVLKAALPERPELRAGTFGRFRQPCGRRAALLVPAAAVSRAGQLETVRVLDQGEVRSRHVRTGKVHGDALEVLAGLDAGEVVIIEGDGP